MRPAAQDHEYLLMAMMMVVMSSPPSSCSLTLAGMVLCILYDASSSDCTESFTPARGYCARQGWQPNIVETP
jgi:putative hemolysin